mgnify:CR=1 FL=1
MKKYLLPILLIGFWACNTDSEDCAGVRGGENYEDNCGVCDDDPTNDCLEDCAGVWGGSSIEDECGVCGGDNSTCSDCNGDIDGEATIDSCGVCDDDDTNDCIQDCAGEWGGTFGFDCGGGCDEYVELWEGSCYNIDSTHTLICNDCGITGEIPPEIGELVNLERISLKNNQFEGEIPPEIGNLGVWMLDLSHNNLSGEIPIEIFNMVSLIDPNIKSLTNLNLNNNQLTGEISPEFIDELKQSSITNLGLGNNHFSGQIPEALCDWVDNFGVTYFDLTFNRFCPPYPQCLNIYAWGGEDPFQFQDCCGGSPETEDCMSDIDGNNYPVVHLGSQSWMAENLVVTHYRNGDPIDYVLDAGWEQSDTGTYNYYQEGNGHSWQYKLGNLYNWYAVSDERNICPDGWHIPSDYEFKQLEMHLGMSEDESNDEDWRGTNEGSKIAGFGTLWENGPLEQNDVFGTSGFNAPGGGYMAPDGGVTQPRWFAYYWTTTEYDSINAWSRSLHYQERRVNRHQFLQNNESKRYGYSCRCVKD